MSGAAERGAHVVGLIAGRATGGGGIVGVFAAKRDGKLAVEQGERVQRTGQFRARYDRVEIHSAGAGSGCAVLVDQSFNARRTEGDVVLVLEIVSCESQPRGYFRRPLGRPIDLIDKEVSVVVASGAEGSEILGNHILAGGEADFVIVVQSIRDFFLPAFRIVIRIQDHIGEPKGAVHLANFGLELIAWCPLRVGQIDENEFSTRVVIERRVGGKCAAPK